MSSQTCRAILTLGSARCNVAPLKSPHEDHHTSSSSKGRESHEDIAGWLAGQLMKGGRFSLVGSLIVGVIGAVLGGYLPEFLLAGLKVAPLPVIGPWLDSVLPTFLTEGLSVSLYFRLSRFSLVTAAVGAVVLLFVINAGVAWKCSGREDAPPSEGPESSRSPSIGLILRRLALALGALFLLLGLIGLYGDLYGGLYGDLYGGYGFRVGVLNAIMFFNPTLLAVGFVLLVLGAGAQAVGHPMSLGFFVTGVVLLALSQVLVLVLVLRGSSGFFDFIPWLIALTFGVFFAFVGGGLLLFFRFTTQRTQGNRRGV